MKEMSKTYAIVEVIEGEQIQLVRRLSAVVCLRLFSVSFCVRWGDSGCSLRPLGECVS